MASFSTKEPIADPIDVLLSAHGLRRTNAARRVLGWLLAHPDTSYTHAQLQAALAEGAGQPGLRIKSAMTKVADSAPLDRVTLYRLIDRLTQVGLLLCRVDASRVRRYQAMPAGVHAMPHFECQSCHRDSPLENALQASAGDLERAAQSALDALKALGYQGMSLDFAVRGVCADCATGASATSAKGLPA
ncbi:MAG: Fur family transcriptional regulator [Polaromonas sp.]|uniref:Fur family transcriptional regulator n=1 Tax=Polaromonas sp. TaxID=1869339 RepID=UPI002723ADF3|nr:Fur family transcriptional regulator [Polaromonas sp.]MDO9114838.1 Fur family transcriptional regulator [Polaromonas sp.]MDP1888735.1 Fur family transcriptional regulator [Polaromonas sp.]